MQNNIFTLRFSEITKYIQYLIITYQRYQESCRGFIVTNRTLDNAITSHGDGPHRLTADEQVLYAASREQSLVLHLDLETIYVDGVPLR